MALTTVEHYVDMARRILQDTVEEYRYEDQIYLDGLNTGLLEMRRIRPDLFASDFTAAVSSYSTVDSTAVSVDEQYRLALVHFICGHVQLTDDEATQDSRAAWFQRQFVAKLLTVAA